MWTTKPTLVSKEEIPLVGMGAGGLKLSHPPAQNSSTWVTAHKPGLAFPSTYATSLQGLFHLFNAVVFPSLKIKVSQPLLMRLPVCGKWPHTLHWAPRRHPTSPAPDPLLQRSATPVPSVCRWPGRSTDDDTRRSHGRILALTPIYCNDQGSHSCEPGKVTLCGQNKRPQGHRQAMSLCCRGPRVPEPHL